ncbi:MAG: hypothetical protein R3330_14265, partial [Saprospiraceae bacterium]|nr:hypothetical protein [Saprospiraceae bacterium]
MSIPLSGQPQHIDAQDSIAQYVMRQIRAEVHKKGVNEVVDIYKANLPFIRLDDSLFSEAIEHFLATGRNDV